MGTHFCVWPQCQHLGSFMLKAFCPFSLPQFYSVLCLRHKNSMKHGMHLHFYRYCIAHVWMLPLTKEMHCSVWLHWKVFWIPVHDECMYNRSPETRCRHWFIYTLWCSGMEKWDSSNLLLHINVSPVKKSNTVSSCLSHPKILVTTRLC